MLAIFHGRSYSNSTRAKLTVALQECNHVRDSTSAVRQSEGTLSSKIKVLELFLYPAIEHGPDADRKFRGVGQSPFLRLEPGRRPVLLSGLYNAFI